MASSGSSAGISPDARILGVLSDTHDNVASAAAGIAALQDAGAQFLIHCGDVGGARILDLLAGIPSAFVWGNCDFDRVGLKRHAAELGIQCCDDFGRLQLTGKNIAFTHGDNARLIQQAIEQCDYVFYGHTHVAADERIGKARLINPGALHRVKVKTVALVDLEKDVVKSLVVGI
jgi:uncharacterized protein